MSLSSLDDSPQPPVVPRRRPKVPPRKKRRKAPKLPSRNHPKHRRPPPPRKKPPTMPTKYLTSLKLNQVPMESINDLRYNLSNLNETILGSPLKAENLRDALELGMIQTAKPYKPITSRVYTPITSSNKITHFNPNHYGVGPVEAALSPQSYVSPESIQPNFIPPPPVHSPPAYLLRKDNGGRKKSRRKLKRKKRKTKRRKNKRKSRRRKVNKRKSRRRK